MKRRTLVKLSLFTTLAAISPKLLSGVRGDRQISPDRELEANLLRVFSHLTSAKAIGKEYLSQLPEPVTKHTLLADFCTRCEGGSTTLAQMDQDTLRTWIQKRERQDFAEGRMVRVRGWVLSQTEVQLCALAALS